MLLCLIQLKFLSPGLWGMLGSSCNSLLPGKLHSLWAFPHQTYCRGCNSHACLQSPCFFGWLVVGMMERLAMAWSCGGGLVGFQARWCSCSFLGFSLPSFFRKRCAYDLAVPQLRAGLLHGLFQWCFFLLFTYDAWSLVYVLQHMF